MNRKPWPPIARTAPAIIATTALALLAGACSSGSRSSAGSGGSPSATGSANSKALAYARCVRSHGVPSFPDPNSAGEFNKTTVARLAASNSQYQTASQTCSHLLPNSSGPTVAEVRQEWNGMASFARCIRSHGVPNWPDPTPYPPRPSEPTFILPASIQPVPKIISKMQICLRLVPNNEVLGHIDNNDWATAQQQMAGQ